MSEVKVIPSPLFSVGDIVWTASLTTGGAEGVSCNKVVSCIYVRETWRYHFAGGDLPVREEDLVESVNRFKVGYALATDYQPDEQPTA